uniref:Pco085865 n=1 Tax=Arundo donax TaxID=35708 RepID=A0A0A9D8P1_ARUDO
MHLLVIFFLEISEVQRVHRSRWLSYQPIALLFGCFGAKWSNQNIAMFILFVCFLILGYFYWFIFQSGLRAFGCVILITFNHLVYYFFLFY